jgi:hypothetical protein
MKPVNNFILLWVALTLPMFLTCPTAKAQNVSLPFTEDWSSGNFYQNGWEFTPSQGNWTISQVGGNNAADFSWDPPLTDYGFMLVSPVIDGTPWSCAKIFLDFDYKLVNMNITGNEKLIVEIFYNNSWDTLMELTNTGSIGWTAKNANINQVEGKEFRIGFRATGAHSNDILHWYIDNVQVTAECRPPKDLVYWRSHFTVNLSWTPPNCGGFQAMQFIYDDGTAENGWCINPGYTARLGNEFPISATYSGILQSFDLWFQHNTNHGNEQLTLDVFDMSHNLLGSSAPFIPPDDSWINVPVNDIAFSGPFLGMVLWNNLTAQTNYLGTDENGPHSSDDLAWYSEGAVWEKLSVAAGSESSVFLLRANAMVDIGKRPDEADSSVLAGYNVYRTDSTGAGPFYLLTPVPVTTTNYADQLPYWWNWSDLYRYHVTAVFKESETDTSFCEPSSDTVLLIVESTDEHRLSKFTCYPNPASNTLTISGTSPINSIEAMNFLGETIYLRRGINDQKCLIDVIGWPSGIYFVKVTDDKQSGIVKLVVQH